MDYKFPKAIEKLLSLKENPSQRCIFIVEYALVNWKRGNETLAYKIATDKDFDGVTSEQWQKILTVALIFDEGNCQEQLNYLEEGYNDDEIWWDERDE